MSLHAVVLSSQAQTDLTRIARYLAEQAGEATARRWAEKLQLRALSLADPMLHSAPHPKLGRGRRTLTVKPYVIVYRLPRPGEVLIARVVHGARDVPALFADER